MLHLLFNGKFEQIVSYHSSPLTGTSFLRIYNFNTNNNFMIEILGRQENGGKISGEYDCLQFSLGT
ncbi:hypothetical protein AS29_007735 [Bacillus sp. SJS]|nr:hypothetical protein AS29_007735 [Bacillus sp. SJS]